MDNVRLHTVANVVGATMKLHPHGDVSIGAAVVSVGRRRDREEPRPGGAEQSIAKGDVLTPNPVPDTLSYPNDNGISGAAGGILRQMDLCVRNLPRRSRNFSLGTLLA